MASPTHNRKISAHALYISPRLSRLPPDAPQEIRSRTYEVTNPEEILVEWECKRREELSLLIDLFIEQIRFGCGSELCIEHSCFSYKQRITGMGPLRRLNPIAAKALAVHMASQDNPLTQRCRLLLSKTALRAPRAQVKHRAEQISAREKNFGARNCGEHVFCSTTKPRIEQRGFAQSKIHNLDPTGKSHEESEQSDHTNVELHSSIKPAKLDTKSFVQSLFSTTSFQLLGWLAQKPGVSGSNLSIDNSDVELSPTKYNEAVLAVMRPSMTAKEAPVANCNEKEQPLSNHSTPEDLTSLISSAALPPVAQEPTVQSHYEIGEASDLEVSLSTGHGENISNKYLKSLLLSTCDGEDPNMIRPHDSPEDQLRSRAMPESLRFSSKSTKAATSTRIHFQGSTARIEVSSTRDSESFRDSETMSSETSDISSEVDTPASSSIMEHSAPLNSGSGTLFKLRPSQPAVVPKSIASHTMLDLSILELGIFTDIFSSNTSPFDRERFTSLGSANTTMFEATSQQKGANYRPFFGHYNQPRERYVSALGGKGRFSPAVSYREEGSETAEFQQTKPSTEYQSLKSIRNRSLAQPILRSSFKIENYPQIWKTFIDQSLFFVLSEKTALIRSYSREENSIQMYDSQMLYHQFKMMLYLNHQLVMTSLWKAAGSLFLLPAELSSSAKSVNAQGCHELSTRDQQKHCELFEASAVIQLCLHALMASLPSSADPEVVFNVSKRRSQGILHNWPVKAQEHEAVIYNDVMGDALALRLAKRVFAALSARLHIQSQIVAAKGKTSDRAKSAWRETPLVRGLVLSSSLQSIADPAGRDMPHGLFTTESRSSFHRVSPILLLDWALTVFMNGWNGSPIITTNSALGGALATINSLYEHRLHFSLGDEYFIAEIFEKRLKDVNMAVKWLRHENNDREAHLLDYPFLFSASVKEKYFRSINFYYMTRANETALSVEETVAHITQPMALLTDPQARARLEQRLSTALQPYLMLNIRRDYILTDAFEVLWRRELRELARPLRVRLGEDEGETGADMGGVQQEFVRLAIIEALKPEYALFTVDSMTKMVWFQPSSPEPLWKFEMIGLIMSLAIYNGLTLPVTLPNAFYHKLLDGSATEIYHIQDGWPDLARGLEELAQWSEPEQGKIDDVFYRTYEFSVPLFGEILSREMKADARWPQYAELFLRKDKNALADPVPEARLVNGLNRDDYIADYIHWLTDVSIAPQFAAFKKGFYTCIHPKSLKLFVPVDLAFLVEGRQDISISELRRFSRYEYYQPHEPYIDDFWDVVGEYDDTGKRKLLEFVTASERLPAAGVKGVTFIIHKNGDEGPEGRLPTSHTCFGMLLLPEYSSKEVLRVKMAAALQNTQGFGML